MASADTLTIIPMSPTYLETVQQAVFRTWLQTYPNAKLGITETHIREVIKPTLTADEIKKWKDFLQNLDTNHIYSYVALIDEMVVGVCRGLKDDNTATLKSLYIVPEYQRKGIGTALWQHFKAWANIPQYIVNVATYNEQAICFYEKLGFVPTGKTFSEERFTFSDGKSIPEMEMMLRVE